MSLQPSYDDRRNFIGGSDAAAVLGLSDWCTPARLWRQKTGREVQSKPDPKRERALARGRTLEPFIRDMVIDKLQGEGHDVELVEVNRRYTDPEFPFLQAEIDFELLIDGEHANVDAKSASGFMRRKWGAEWSDEIPADYAAQFLHGQMVTGRGRTLVGAQIGLDDVRLYWQHRDDAVIAGLRAREVAFWRDHVLADVPPDPLVFPDLRDRYPEARDRTVEATEAIADAVHQLREVRREKRRLDGQDAQLCLQIGQYMRDAARLSVQGELVLTWGNEQRTQFLLDQFRAKHKGLAELFTERGTQRVMRLANLRGRR